jgi:hypothetical protein
MAGGFMDKVKDFVKGNPEQASGAIEKVEDLVDQRTGGKHSEHVDKGGDLLREKLGLPPEELAATQPDATEPDATEPDATQPDAQPAGTEPVAQEQPAPPLPQGGTTQQGEEQPLAPRPGERQPDTGGPARQA